MELASLITAPPPGNDLDRRSPLAKADIRLCGACDLAMEADHRIANHLAMLGSYVQLKQADIARQSDAGTDAMVQMAFDSIRCQITAVSRLHRSLATRRDGTAIDLRDHLHQVCAPLMSGLSGAIELTEDLHPDCLVRSAHVLPLTQIVSEVITNAIKYSHAKGETGVVSVGCHSLSGGEIEIEVTDDGPGLPQRFDPLAPAGLGVRLVRALTAQIGARSGFESSAAGTRFWILIPAAPDVTGPTERLQRVVGDPGGRHL